MIIIICIRNRIVKMTSWVNNTSRFMSHKIKIGSYHLSQFVWRVRQLVLIYNILNFNFFSKIFTFQYCAISLLYIYTMCHDLSNFIHLKFNTCKCVALDFNFIFIIYFIIHFIFLLDITKKGFDLLQYV